MAAESSQSAIKKYSKGDIIFLEGDLGEEMYFIRSGQVEIVREMGDSQITLEELNKNEFFGEMSLFGSPQRSATARAGMETEVLIINKRALNIQFRKVPEWLVTIIKTVAKRILQTNKGVKARFPISFEYSVLRAIVLLAVEFGTPEQKRVSLNLALVRQELCNILGVNFVDVDEWLKKFNFVNLIKTISSKNQLFIPDQERLEKFILYLELKKGNLPALEKEFDANAQHAMERIVKLLSR